MSGATTYWRIMSVINSDCPYVETGRSVRATPETHPKLSTKISRLFRMLTDRTKQKRKLEQIHMKNGDENSNSSDSIEFQFSTNEATVDGGEANDGAKDVAAKNNDPSKCAVLNNTTDNANDVAVEEQPANEPNRIRRRLSNIPISSMAMNNLPLIPIPNYHGQFWLMLKIEDDFTHMWFPNRQKYMKAKLIRFSLEVAMAKSKTVLLSQSGFHPQVYATHVFHDTIFIGPYVRKIDMDVALFRRSNGRMVLLEMYEQEQKAKLTKRSMGMLYPHSYS